MNPAIPAHETRITAIVLEAVKDNSPAAQAQTYKDLAQLTRSDDLCVELMQLAKNADDLANDSRQLRLRLTAA